MGERLRGVGQLMYMKDDRIPKIVLFDQPSMAERKADRPRLRGEDVIKKDLKEMESS